MQDKLDNINRLQKNHTSQGIEVVYNNGVELKSNFAKKRVSMESGKISTFEQRGRKLQSTLKIS